MQPLTPKGGNDRVYTPPWLAKAIVQHFNPTGSSCDPCFGGGAFVNALDATECTEVIGFEIDKGMDFLEYSHPDPGRFNWIITNPPWSKLRQFLKKSMEVSDNVVFLCLVNAFFMKARMRDMQEAGFGMREILFVPTPPKPWPQTGFALGAVHIQRGYDGVVKFTNLPLATA